MKSFALIKTNVALTTNIKIMVDSEYNLYLDSIESSPELSENKYKKVQFNNKNYYDELIPYFYKGLSTDISFRVKDDNDSSIMFKTFDKQIDDLYITGCTNIIDNKYYTEDYEYFAPLYVSKTGLPKYFVIFRIDGPGIIELTKDNFKEEIINKLKCVKIVDLTKNSNLGVWLYNNITNNPSFPLSTCDIDFRSSELSYWNGIDYNEGAYTQKALFLDINLETENTFSDFEKFITDGYKNNNIVYPNILNLSFLFNDKPASANSLRKWSLNRYSGFYLENMEQITSLSTYIGSIVLPDAYITTGNIITNPSNFPFSESTFKMDKIFVEYLGNFYKVKKVIKTDSLGNQKINWTIISDIDLVGKESYLNKNMINIDSNNKITLVSGATFSIDNWNTADVWLIKIGNKYHNIQYESGDYYIYSDYAFSISTNKLTYYINYPDPNYSYTIDMLNGDFPETFPVYRLKFSDVKSFDETIIETDFAKFEYNLEDKVIQTDEPKMYMTNLLSTSNPKSLVDYTINSLPVNIPEASHYTANHESFRINEDNTLNLLWKKNSQSLKWGFMNSYHNDYKYPFNNSFIAEENNKTTNTYITTPIRIDRNLDYFLTINSSTSSYYNHSLHVEEIQDNSVVDTYSFNVNEYINNGYDYFSYFFDRKMIFNSSKIIKNVSKYSEFNSGDKSFPNITLFNGIKYTIYDVESVKIINNQLQTINIVNNNTYADYKFSVLLSKNNWTIETNTSEFNQISITSSNNNLSWIIVDSWKYNKEYNINDVVEYLGVLYQATTISNIEDPKISPATSADWNYYTNTIFWNPSITYSAGYTINNIVYNYGEYYYNNGNFNTFYIPGNTYSYNDIVKFNNRVWISTTGSNTNYPESENVWYDSSNNANYFWQETTETDATGTPQTAWSVIPLWDSLNIYTTTNLVVYNDTVYSCNVSSTTVGVTPDSTTDWTQIYTMLPNTTYVYGTSIALNNTIFLNNRYYICTGNNNSTLDNGINIFINKKWKNILVNIYINDNTLTNLSNTDRDDIYKDIYTNLTAYNFINSINDITNNYGFTNKVKYIILDETENKIYDFNNINSFNTLTSLITAQGPDEFKSKILSLNKVSSTLSKSQFTAKFNLNNGQVVSKNQLNYYNNLSLGSKISYNQSNPAAIPSYSGLKNNFYNTLFRHSGFYDPIFLSVELFKKGLTYSGNYIFDTELSNFGKTNQTIISKINRLGSVLKFRNSPNLRSIYPMIDEFGYTTSDLFIFKSNWDTKYFTECKEANPVISPITNIATSRITDISVKYQPISITPKNLL